MNIHARYYAFILVAVLPWQGLFAQRKNQMGSQPSRPFSIAIIPDTQYNTKESQGGSNALFDAQVEWILANREQENIAYVIHLGDITDDGDKAPKQWENAAQVMYKLEKPLPGLPHGIPYGLAVGNHDQLPSQFAASGSTKYFNHYFGVQHFNNKAYYGGHFGDDNDSHFDLFSAGGIDFIVLYVEFDAFDEQQDAMNNWAASVLETHNNRKAIVVTHYTLFLNPVAGSNAKGRSPFSKQAKRLYDRLKQHKNFFMMAGGHVGDNGEGFRQDSYNGSTVKSFLSDYQSRPMGGNGMMRLMRFDLEKDQIQVRTFSPYHDYEELDADSHFTLGLFREAAASRILDFDLDGKSDLMIYQQGNWFDADKRLRYSQWNAGAVPAPSYYEGNAQTQPAAYNSKKAMFILKNGESIPFGQPGAMPVPADYDGDGLADLAVWHPASSIWEVKGQDPITHGWAESTPVPADYDGDGAAEKAVWRWSNSTWYIAEVGNVPFGKPGDVPVPADYNGDGKAEIAVWRPTTGEWLIHGMEKSMKLGKQGDLPIPGDYDGTGKVQCAIFDPEKKIVLFESGESMSLDTTLEEVVNLPYAIKSYYLNLLKK
ncbi:metallophosphoesterase [Sphingobacterium deserti]|uniref:Metallophosphoesterase n=1 Tax=Sphingobacterium deserti TaxID=1229276 RepID=A0A0B8T909_9SPHI|nr:metallophosphoesterase [Sphingobacterium deserti]KGE14470.1 metallophosphoesterase [Sphingobacterium deserti]